LFIFTFSVFFRDAYLLWTTFSYRNNHYLIKYSESFPIQIHMKNQYMLTAWGQNRYLYFGTWKG
jgi:hypothetical protein